MYTINHEDGDSDFDIMQEIIMETEHCLPSEY